MSAARAVRPLSSQVIKTGGPTVSAAVRRGHIIPMVALKQLQEPTDPRFWVVKERYEFLENPQKPYNMVEKGLWLVSNAWDLPNHKALRVRTKRRVLGAIKEELRSHGYDQRGRQVKKKLGAEGHAPRDIPSRTLGIDRRSPQISHKVSKPDCLVGYVEFHVKMPAIEADGASLRQDAKKIVGAILGRCSWYIGSGYDAKDSKGAEVRSEPVFRKKKKEKVDKGGDPPPNGTLDSIPAPTITLDHILNETRQGFDASSSQGSAPNAPLHDQDDYQAEIRIANLSAPQANHSLSGGSRFTRMKQKRGC